MNKSVVIAVVVIAALALGLPALSKLSRKPAEVVPAPASADAKPEASVSAAPAPALAPAADAQTFVGSTWSIKGATVALQANGAASVRHPSVPMPMQGTWSLAANTLTVSVMGQSYTVQVSGDKLMLDGKPVERAQ